MFAGDPASVEIIRTNKEGEKISIAANLDAIKRGQEPDLSVQAGDVIDISASGPKAVAYGFYRFFTAFMHVGASASIPIR
jgi:hypothetical protein